MDLEAEITELKRRISTLENEAKSEQQFSVRLFRLSREMRDDIALLRTHAMVTGDRVGRLEERMDRLEQRLERLETDLSALRTEFDSFRRDLPGMIAETMREVLREYRGR